MHRTVLLHAIAIGARAERIEEIADALVAAMRAEALRDADAAVEELETRARSQKRNGKTVADRSAGHSAEYALACARTAIRALVSK